VCINLTIVRAPESTKLGRWVGEGLTDTKITLLELTLKVIMIGGKTIRTGWVWVSVEKEGKPWDLSGSGEWERIGPERESRQRESSTVSKSA